MQPQKMLNRDIYFTAKKQNRPLKRQFWKKTKNITSKIYGILIEWCFQILDDLTFKWCFCFWHYLVYFVTEWIFQLWDFFRTYLATFRAQKLDWLDWKTAFRITFGPWEAPKLENLHFHFQEFSGWGTSRGQKLILNAVC